MNSKEYINNHDFGYGKEPERRFLNKLYLRNIDDVKEYIFDVINNAFDCELDNLSIKFLNEKNTIEIVIEEV